MGPLLFNLFIDDISKINCDGIILYADDGAFCVIDNNYDLLMSRVQLLVNNIAEWLSNNRLFPNTLKTYLMFFNYRNNSPLLPNIYFNSDILSWIDSFKYLGMIIDNKLSFKLHISYINNKISRGVGALNRLRYFCHKNILLKIYHSLVYSHIIQNIVIWGGVSDNKVNCIQVSMNNALRSILNVKFINHVPNLSTNQIYLSLNIFKFRDLYKYFILKFIHSFLYGNHQSIFYNYFLDLMPLHTYNTRHRNINLPNIRLEVEKSLTVYNSAKIINDFPEHLLTPQSTATLKVRYKDFVMEKYNSLV